MQLSFFEQEIQINAAKYYLTQKYVYYNKKSNLEFTLRQQEFIELVRAQRCVEAVHHARKYFVNLNATQLIDVQKSMVLLAYVKSTDASTYQELLNENRWEQLIDLFKQENYKIHQLPEQSSFTAILQAGLSAMKTPTCYRKVTSVKNPNCPVCHPSLNVIARPLPYAYCANSKLICAHSGAAMNENNVPMMLPNGYVFSINVSKI
jgi:macrophage erythroblast attacher